MSNIVLCPNCGGQKIVSKPPYIAGDVNAWVSSGTPTYPCPTCEGCGWIRVDSVSQVEFDSIKSVALLSMETAENLMDECTKRADRITELEAELERIITGERAADEEIERLCRKLSDDDYKDHCIDQLLIDQAALQDTVHQLRMKIFDIEGREDLVTTHLKSMNKELETLLEVREARMIDMQTRHGVGVKSWEKREQMLLHAVADRDRDIETIHNDCEMLDDILKVVNPLIKSGMYARKEAEKMLAGQMYGLCRNVVQYRREHNIVG